MSLREIILPHGCKLVICNNKEGLLEVNLLDFHKLNRMNFRKNFILVAIQTKQEKEQSQCK